MSAKGRLRNMMLSVLVFMASQANAQSMYLAKQYYDQGYEDAIFLLAVLNDGWFTYTRTVSDGWRWNNSIPNFINGTIRISDSSISRKDIYNLLVSNLANGRKKVEEGVFTKNIKAGGKTVKCRTSLSSNEGDNHI